MNSQLKLLIYIAVIAALFFFLQDKLKFLNISFLQGAPENNQNENQGKEGDSNETNETSGYVVISKREGGEVHVNVEVADDDTERRAGLSNRKYLGDYDGMLFVFDERVSVPFWMKDMYIPLDLLFIDSDGFVVDIKAGNQPCTETYCPAISSSKMFRYVLEVRANFAEINGVEIGNSVALHIK